MLEIEKVDLNEDGKTEYRVRVQSILVCSPTGNCPTAFYGIVNDNSSIMRTSAGVYDFSFRKFLFRLGVINFELKNAKTKGYKDIVLRFNGSSYDNYLELYQFNGKTYQRTKCFEENKQMKTTSTKCWKDEN